MRITLDQILAAKPCWAQPLEAVKDCNCEDCVEVERLNKERGRLETPKEAFLRTAKGFGLDKTLDETAEEWDLNDVLNALSAAGYGLRRWLEDNIP